MIVTGALTVMALFIRTPVPVQAQLDQVPEWDIIDMTDNIGRWDLSQLGGGMTMTWDQAEAFVTTAYPNHKVLSGSLVDDSSSFAPRSCGQAYYDLFTFENRTLEQDQDTVRNGQ